MSTFAKKKKKMSNMTQMFSLSTVHQYILLVAFTIGIVADVYSIIKNWSKPDKKIRLLKMERDILLIVILSVGLWSIIRII